MEENSCSSCFVLSVLIGCIVFYQCLLKNPVVQQGWPLLRPQLDRVVTMATYRHMLVTVATHSWRCTVSVRGWEFKNTTVFTHLGRNLFSHKNLKSLKKNCHEKHTLYFYNKIIFPRDFQKISLLLSTNTDLIINNYNQ